MSIHILSAGSLSTIQDLGRFGYQASGFSPSGAADPDALRTLNVLLGNDSGEAAVEMTAGGMTLEFTEDCFFALTGADNGPELSGEPVAMYTVHRAKAGDKLSCSFARKGIRTYFGVTGGFDVPSVMGSRSTGMRFAVGGFKGRKLAADDLLPLREHGIVLPGFGERRLPAPKGISGTVTLHVVPGPQDDCFPEDALKQFFSGEYKVTPSMDRMGIRLSGAEIPALDGYDIISDATVTGSIQITNDGHPIILMNDRQTTGGYAKIGTVVSADLSLAGQLYPGASVRFSRVDVETAQRMHHRRVIRYRDLSKKFPHFMKAEEAAEVSENASDTNVRYANASPAEMRALFRENRLSTNTSGMCAGYAQANLVVLPKSEAYDFLLFAQRNPAPCPILEVSDEGSRYLSIVAKGADIARDIPKYRLYEHGVLTGEFDSVDHLWRDDFVSFLIGCSFSFEAELLAAGIPVRQIEEGRNVPMYLTNIPLQPAGIFHGNMVVSMRPMTPEQAIKATVITSQMPRVHGKPVHIGDPAAIGIRDINKPDFGDSVTIREGEIPVFWPCGVTPQAAVMAAKPPIVITHAPGYMMITDVKNTDLKN